MGQRMERPCGCNFVPYCCYNGCGSVCARPWSHFLGGKWMEHAAYNQGDFVCEAHRREKRAKGWDYVSIVPTKEEKALYAPLLAQEQKELGLTWAEKAERERLRRLEQEKEAAAARERYEKNRRLRQRKFMMVDLAIVGQQGKRKHIVFGNLSICGMTIYRPGRHPADIRLMQGFADESDCKMCRGVLLGDGRKGRERLPVAV